ncbi:berberine bridge enzyme-like 15 [Malania oleifera]|uniref:berberine bridge enzyme-like 15 n=1 Tax=Malania oleifera TaxID=397392 RepID=UPI0025ADD81B|nr:berberine bridge enzyme-like 15 [Malania oleifera]
MECSNFIIKLCCLLFLLRPISCATSNSNNVTQRSAQNPLNSSGIAQAFSQCLSTKLSSSTNISGTIYTPDNSSFKSLLVSTAQNLRYLVDSMPKPEFIFTPLDESQAQAAVICCQQVNVSFRMRSGGHDYEGMSYVSQLGAPFSIIDLQKLRNVIVNIKENYVWAESGATNGEVYYKISQQSNVHGFPMGLCTSLGMGGHICGGAYGSIMRKYGLGVDKVLDIRMVDANGAILDREAMGDELFWAVAGGGGSFGLILAWKLSLVPVPPTVTVFTVVKTLEQGGTRLLSKWTQIADKLDNDLFIRVIINPMNTPNGTKTISLAFNSQFLGTTDKLLQIMGQNFSELGLQRGDCSEMRWIESVLYIAGYPSTTKPEVLLLGQPLFKNFFKAKSDFIPRAIPESGIQGMWNLLFQEPGSLMIWNPLGGQVAEVSPYSTPFFWRDSMGFIQYLTTWANGNESTANHIEWIRKLYDYMTPYVSMFPRAAYVNYKDLDLGSMIGGPYANWYWFNMYEWGYHYFGRCNFERLIYTKSKIDPKNVFKTEQSIPTFLSELREN